LLPLLILVSAKAISQTNQSIRRQIDSLKLLSTKAGNDTLQLKYFTSMARLYRFVDVDSSKHLLKQAIESYKIKKVDKRMHAFAYNVIADIFRVEQKIDSALFYYEEAYQYFLNDENPKPYLAIAPSYGNFLIKNKEVDKGINIFRKAIQIAIDNNDNHNLSYLYASLGNILYEIQDDKAKAKTIFKKGIVASKKMDNEKNFLRTNMSFNLGLAKISFDDGKIDSTIYYAKNALTMAHGAMYYQKALISCNLLCQSSRNSEHQSNNQNKDSKACNPST